MAEWIRVMVACTLSMTVIALILAALTPLLAKRYKARGLYVAWVIVVLGFVIPWRPQITVESPVLEFPSAREYTLYAPEPQSGYAAPPVDYQLQQLPEKTVVRVNPAKTVFIIWLLGAVGAAGYHVAKNLRFMKMCRRWSRPVEDEALLERFDIVKHQMLEGMTDFTLYTNPLIKSPMIMGHRHPKILLPSKPIAEGALAAVLRHEIVHYKRRDARIKAFLLAACAMHWFNPVMYLVARYLSATCETSCDETAMRYANMTMRKNYSVTIIETSHQPMGLLSILATALVAHKSELAYRLRTIMECRPKKNGASVAALVMCGVFSVGIAFAANPAEAVLVTDELTPAIDHILGPEDGPLWDDAVDDALFE